MRQTTTAGRRCSRAALRARSYAARSSSTPRRLGHVLDDAAQRPGVRREVDVHAAVGSGAAGVGEHVVEPLRALVGLQPVDHGEARVVAEHRHVGVTGEGSGVELGVEHQVGAVAVQRSDQPVRMGLRTRHRGAPGCDHLVAHAREAVLEVHRGARGRGPVVLDDAGAPASVQLARHPAGRGQDVVLRAAGVVHDADDLGVGEPAVGCDTLAQPVDVRVPVGQLAGRLRGPALVGRPVPQRLVQLDDGRSRRRPPRPAPSA